MFTSYKMIKYIFFLWFATIAICKKCPPDGDLLENSLTARANISQNVKPISYVIWLEPVIEKEKFNGRTSITLLITEPVQEIVLHANQLNITKANINCTGTKNVTALNITCDKDLLTVRLSANLTKNDLCILTFPSFSGKFVNNSKDGFYLAKYLEDGKTKVFATTQFQRSGARKVFPCFDEPHLKATFKVYLIRSENYISISCEELLKSLKYGGKVIDIYKETRPMSTYLLAFIVTQYNFTQKNQGQRVFADKTAVSNGDADYALEMGIKVLTALENFTEVRYSFSKIDQIGIPDDWFGPGAMENWGLVTYKKSAIVYPYNSQVTRGMQKTVSIIAHEYAHQWFGNLVTCASWKYVGWYLDEMFVMDSVHGALKDDSVNSTTAMNNDSASSAVLYQKAGSVIRMLSHMVTQDIFKKALKLYLTENSYKATTPNNLYKAFQTVLEAENKKDLMGNYTVSEIMTTWDSQAGYPFLYVKREDNKINVTQERFFTDNTTESEPSKWIIPLTYVFESDSITQFFSTTTKIWMNERSITINAPDGWFVFNTQQTGFYRVLYDNQNWNELVYHLNNVDHTSIHTLNRIQLIDDAFTFAQIDKMNYTDVLELSRYLVKDREYVPIAVFLKHAAIFDNKLSEEYGREYYKMFMRNLLSGGSLDEVTMEEKVTDTHLDKYLRIEILNWLCKMGHQECKEYTLNIFRNDSKEISPDMQQPIYCGAMRVGNESDWNKLFGKYEDHNNSLSLNKNRILNGLGCSENNKTLDGYLNKFEKNINQTDTLSAFRSILNSGDFGRNYLFDYLIKHYETIKYFNKIDTIVKDISAKLYTKEHLENLTALADKHPDQKVMFDAAKSIVNENVNWNIKYGSSLKEWFELYSSTNTALSIKSQNEDQCTKEITEKVSRATGVSIRTIERIIKEGSTLPDAETDKRFKSPEKKTKSVARAENNRKLLIEKSEIRALRIDYLKKNQFFHQQQRPIVFVDTISKSLSDNSNNGLFTNNAPYHNVQINRAHNSNSRKADMVFWVADKKVTSVTLEDWVSRCKHVIKTETDTCEMNN
ncbi:hypothetical protein FQA39_LY09706 [Lamprigera yunnana]|nr:hypothetical protein FQA39_LY09706 [Lamprigera yunnana]